MNILFLSYWGLNDGLNVSTVLPHLRILERYEKIERVVLCTIERDESLFEGKISDKVFHIPWASSHRFLAKVNDFTMLPSKIISIIEKFNIQFMFCRGTPAGAIGYLVHRRTGLEYAVESFEPHADYMHESGVWCRWDLRYILQRHWEKRQFETARHVLPVTRQYVDFLNKRGPGDKKIIMMPCAVDLEMFSFSIADRRSLREGLGLTNDVIVGIYVGKFGGMYYDDEAFHVFSTAKKHFDKFFLIILSPDQQHLVESKLLKAGYLSNEYLIRQVPHKEVPRYLSASDFAFATYKSGYFKRFLSPIKVGEYWAAGLPVLITDGVGDDHLIIEQHNIGSVFSFDGNRLKGAFLNLKAILKEGRVALNARVQPVAARYRNFKQHERIYTAIIDALS